MKKILAILLTAAMLLGCVGASAESIRFVEDSTAFDIEMELPEGAKVEKNTASDEVSIVIIKKEGLAQVSINIAPSELYEEQSLGDLSDEEIEALKLLAGLQYDTPNYAVDVTPSGNKYIYVCANSEYDMDSIFTVYKGYFVELTQWHDDYSTVTEEDKAFMLQLLYNINFLPL